MNALTRFGIEKSRFTSLLMIVILLLGVLSYFGIPKRENPVITIRTAVVAVTFDGMAPTRVENLIAIPVERKIREIGEVEDIETIITTGQALIYVTLYDRIVGAQIEAAWEDLRNKMQQVVGELPDGTSQPFVNTEYGDVSIATIAVTGDGFSLSEIEDVADDLRTDLYQVDGISKVTLYGTQEERVWLEVDTRKLAAVGVQIQQLLDDLSAQNVIMPAGEIDAGGTKIVLEANGDLASVDEIRGVLTKVNGLAGYVRLGDLVEVRRGYEDPRNKPVFFNKDSSVVLAIEMAATADIQDLGRRLTQRISDFEVMQPIGITFNVSTFQETIVTASVDNALSNVGQTFLIVLVVMLLFLGLRSAVVIACIVPFTISFALTMFTPLGVDVQQVSIAAVIISLGLLVDNGLVVVEDIDGRINNGEDPREAALDAGGQYTIPLAVASITTISAFIPMLLVEGTAGEFSYALGAVVGAMLFGSWLTALYILPYLCTLLLRRKAKANSSENPFSLTKLYGRMIRVLLPFGIPILIASYAAVGYSASLVGSLKSEMFPYSERADFLIYMDLPKEAAVSRTEELALRVQDWLTDEDANPGILNSTVYVGDGGPRFNLGLNPADPDPSSAFFQVNTRTLEDAVETAARARRVFVEQFPEARFRVTRLPQGGTEAGVVDVEISGPSAEVLLTAAEEVETAIAALPRVVKNESNWGNKVVKVVVDVAQDKAREFGVTSQDISRVMDSYFSGTAYSTFREGDDQIPIVMRATSFNRDSLDDLANLAVAAQGQLISVDQVAVFQPVLEYSEIRRENQVRQIIVSGKSEALSATEMLEKINPTLEELDLGSDYRIAIGGELEDSADSNGQMGDALPYALGVMLAALVFQFNSLRRSIVTFLTIPLIIIGAPILMLSMGHPMSFFAVLGLMSLMGIIINNAIVLINQIDIDSETMGMRDAVVSAAQKRARPVILTSLTTVCGLIPMAYSGGAMFEPMAAIMIGGLLVASPLTLIFVPPVAYLFLRPWHRESQEAIA